MRKLCVAIALAVLAPGARAQVVLKLGTLAPSGSAWHDALKEMAQRWDDASGGQVKLRVYAGGAQGSEGEMIRKVGIAQLQAAALTNVGLHDVVSEAQAFSVPMLFADGAELSCAFARVQEELEAAFERKGLVVLQWTRLGTASFFCDAALRTPAEVGRARIFAWEGDPEMVEAWRAAGFRPVVLSSTELVPALQTGMIDCVSNLPVYVLTARIFERARFMLDVPLGSVLAATVVRKDAWERVPAPLRARLLEIAREEARKTDAEASRLETESVAAMRRQGLEVVGSEPGPWRTALERGWPVLRGRVVPAAFFDAVKAARDACRAAARR